MSDRIYYFGVWSGQSSGHFLYGPDGRHFHTLSVLPDDFPVKIEILDTGFLGTGRMALGYGQAVLSHVGEWTILSFWDSSGDSRPGSNSNFVMDGTECFHEAVRRARAAFPKIWERFTFDVVDTKVPDS